MSRIYSALQLHSGTRVPVKAIEQYIRTGNEKVLAQLKPVQQKGWSWEGTVLAGALGKAGDWTDEDRRLVHVLHALGLVDSLGEWLNDVLRQEKADADAFAPLRGELEACKATTAEIAAALGRVRAFERDGKPTSAGRFVLSLADADLQALVKQTFYDYLNLELVDFLIEFALDRIPQLLPLLLKERGHSSNASAAASLILQKAGKRFEPEIHAFFLSMKDTWHRFHLGQTLYDYDRAKYGAEALAAARASLAGPSGHNNHGPIGEWMLEKFGVEVLDDMVEYLDDEKQNLSDHWKSAILRAAVVSLARDALPAVHATLRGAAYSDLRLDAINYLISLNDGAQDNLIQAELEGFLKAEPDARPSYRTTDSYTLAVRAIGLVGRWEPKRFADHLWGLFTHKSKAVRDAAARVLGLAGDDNVAAAAKLLQDKKAATRLAAVLVLTTANTAAALKALENRLDKEADDTVRDAILLGLEAAWAAQGRKVTKKDVEARIARAADKLASIPAAWIDEAKLPRLVFKDGKPVNKDAVRYLLYRQSRAKEMRPDIEAKALFAMIDRGKSGEFALEILKAFLRSKTDAQDRWALAVAGLLGDDRVAPILSQQIREWADGGRGKMAEHAVEALALLGTDAALLMVDALAIRYRSKNKNVGRAAVESFNAAAASLGLTPEELGDRVVPWLGFEPDKPRVVDCGSKKVETRIGLDFKLKFIDVEKKKPVASLPKSAPKEVLAEFKELGATLREVAKAQVLRLENLMVRQHRWPMERWRKLFPVHPLLMPMTIRLIWGVYDDAGKLLAAFRMLEDRSFTQASDEPFELPAAGNTGIVHPLELSADERQAWQTHLADYEIEPPFPQLDRPVVKLSPDRTNQKTLSDYAGIGINGMTFKGRAERLGWTRGSVCDGGGITSYVKGFPAAGVDVFLGLDGMYIGIDMYSEIKLQDAFFAKAGSVTVGSYTYDEPRDEQDGRLLRFGEVPALVYSEVLGDLQKISGKSAAAEE
jgi:hypothetical protein